MRIPILTAVLVVAIATTTGCGGNDKKTDKANTPTTSAQSSTTASTSTTDTTATTAPSTSDADGGTSDPEPGRVVVQYFNALSKRDSKGACAYMGNEMKRAAIDFVKSSLKTTTATCADAIAKIIRPQTPAALAKARNLQILKSNANGNSATVKVKGALRNALLTKRGGRWLITGGIFTSP